MNSPTVLLFLLFSFCLYDETVLADGNFLSSPTGQRINLDDIKTLLTPPIPKNNNIDKLIFEVTNEHVLFSHNGVLYLRNETSQPTEIRTSISTVSRTQRPVHLFSRSGYKVSYTYDQSGVVVDLTVNNNHLEPLDQTKYPGIFLNRFGLSSTDKAEHSENKTISVESVGEELVIEDIDPILPAEARVKGLCESKVVQKVVKIAVAYDHTFCHEQGDEVVAEQAIKEMISRASQAFEKVTCLSFKLVYVEGTCNAQEDNYKSASTFKHTDTYLSFTSMRDYWRNNRDHIKRDLALFYVGYDQFYRFWAFGHSAGVCGDEGYAWVNGKSDVHTAHRIGRLLDASFDEKTGNIMNRNPTMVAPMRISDFSAWSVNSFIDDNPLANCITSDDGGNSEPQSPNGIQNLVEICGIYPAGNALSCDSGFLGSISTASGNAYVSIRQEHGQFRVSIEAQSGSNQHKYYITTYSRAITMEPNLDRSRYEGVVHHPAPRSTRVSTNWDGTLIQKQGIYSNTCCNHPLYVYITVGVERHNLDGSGETKLVVSSGSSAIFSWNVQCRPCQISSYRPMDARNKCPVCY